MIQEHYASTPDNFTQYTKNSLANNYYNNHDQIITLQDECNSERCRDIFLDDRLRQRRHEYQEFEAQQRALRELGASQPRKN